MKAKCSLCGEVVQVSRSRIAKDTLRFWDEHKVYICKICRRKVAMKKLKELAREVQK